MWEIFEKLRKEKGLSAYQICKDIGEPSGMISNWKAGRYTPKADKMQKIADYFNVSVEYLTTGIDTEKKSDSGKKYYFSDETAQMAQELYETPGMRILFDAARGSKPEDMQMAADLLKRLKGTNPDG